MDCLSKKIADLTIGRRDASEEKMVYDANLNEANASADEFAFQ